MHYYWVSLGYPPSVGLLSMEIVTAAELEIVVVVNERIVVVVQRIIGVTVPAVVAVASVVATVVGFADEAPDVGIGVDVVVVVAVVVESLRCLVKLTEYHL
ncbi:unnamed protein product [[Candida] boidinii]|uniref:Unnamed protein product n=1 Tax=Candida boidinii TaxID=5477 RepID=A0A9W6WKL7_CANBO|nr:unnamed protein product [[Candida] boidinii]